MERVLFIGIKLMAISKMDKQKLRLILRILLLLSLIFLLIIFNIVPKNNCQACKFPLDKKNVSISYFMERYYERCVYPYKQQIISIDDLNASIKN